MLDFGIRPAHVLYVRCAGFTTRPPTQILKSFEYRFISLSLKVAFFLEYSYIPPEFFHFFSKDGN